MVVRAIVCHRGRDAITHLGDEATEVKTSHSAVGELGFELVFGVPKSWAMIASCDSVTALTLMPEWC